MLLFEEKVPGNRAEFIKKVKAIAIRKGINPDWLMGVMNSETGGKFTSNVYNQAGSGAVGLIQFMPDTARELGTSTAALAAMPNVEQLDYVEKYIDMWKDRLNLTSIPDYDDLYLMVFYPKAIGKPSSYVIAKRGSITYAQNAGMDMNQDGTIDVGDFKKFTKKKIPVQYLWQFVPQWRWMWPFLALLAIIVLAFCWYWFGVQQKSVFDLPLLNRLKKK